jgi:hypothetical protein
MAITLHISTSFSRQGIKMITKLLTAVCCITSIFAGQSALYASSPRTMTAQLVTNLNTGLTYATIKEAVDAATTLNGHELLVSNGTYTESLVFNKSVALVGEAQDLTVLNGNRTQRIVDITEGLVVTLTNLSLINGGGSDFRCGAAIFNLGKITVISATISNAVTGNTFDSCGQAIVNRGQMHLNNVVVAGNGTSSKTLRDAMISNSSGGVLTMTRAIVRNNLGTGLWNDGTATITRSQVIENRSEVWAAVVNYSGRLNIQFSEISGNTNSGQEGGGIYNNSVASVSDSMIQMNYANGNGGGIFNLGTLTVTRSTIARNELRGSGSMPGFIGRGGGIANTNQITIINSTLGINVATDSGGGLANYKNASGPASPTPGANLVNTTVSYNVAQTGGGISTSDGELKIVNTLIGHNAAITGKECNGVVTSNGHNFIASIASCSFNALSSDKAGSSARPMDPYLGPLGDFGGSAPTVGLRRGSPAINNGDVTVCQNIPTDQRGYDRVGDCDIGAFEFGIGPQVVDDFLVLIRK